MVELPVKEKVTVTQRRGMPITLSSTITPLTISSRTTKRQTRHNIQVLGPNVNPPLHLPLQPPHPPPLKSTHLCHRINIHSSLHIPHIPNLSLRRHPPRSQTRPVSQTRKRRPIHPPRQDGKAARPDGQGRLPRKRQRYKRR